MSSSENNALTIADLPSDIIRVIIAIGLEDAFDSMRLISPPWNALALDRLRDRKGLPTIDWLDYDDKETALKMQMSIKYLPFFGLQNFQHLRTFDSDTSKAVIEISFWAALEKNNERLIKRIARIFERCSNISKFTIYLDKITEEIINLENLRTILGDVAIQELSISDLLTFNNNSVTNIISILRNLSVQHVVVKLTSNLTLSNQLSLVDFRLHFDLIATMLSEALNLVTTIDLSIDDYTTFGWNESSTKAYWELYARDLSTTTSVIVDFNMKMEFTMFDDIMRFTLTARKHAEL